MTIREIVGKVVIIATVILSSSCSSRTIYSHYESVSRLGWNADSLVEFVAAIPDTAAEYELTVYVRHTSQYPYQNIWILAGTDTIGAYMADDRGRWLGAKRGGVYELALPVRTIRPKQDTLRLAVGHGMREEDLIGITDIGIYIDGKE